LSISATVSHAVANLPTFELYPPKGRILTFSGL
jgi:hypothetical protein